MESTFRRSNDNTSNKNFTKSNTFDRDVYAKELNDAYEGVSTFNKTTQETQRRNFITADLNVDHCLLKHHEVFPGYNIDKPIPCKRLPNMSRDIEEYCSAESSHFVGRSYNRVIKMLENEQWEKLFDFSYNSALEIIRDLYREMDVDDQFMLADIPLFLEHGAVKGVISYPEYYELLSLSKVSEKRSTVHKVEYNHEGFSNIKPKYNKYDYYYDHTLS